MRTDRETAVGAGVITDALRTQGLASEAPAWLEWYRDGLIVYAKTADTCSPADDVKVAVVETVELAEEIVNAHNQLLAHVQSPRFNKHFH